MMLRFEGITKRFGDAPVLREVSFGVGSGEIVGVVGENGAGKSTLMNILGGVCRADSGQMWLADAGYAPEAPADAARAGIAFVHQELSLFPTLSIAENLQIARLPCLGPVPWIDRRRLRARAHAALGRVGLAVPPETVLDALSAGERQLVEIARALDASARVLILDEPGTSLGVAERRRLLELMHGLRASGLAQIFISHDLDDVRRICDRIVVLRDGRVVAEGTPDALSHAALVGAMVGRALSTTRVTRRAQPAAAAPPGLEVRALTGPGTAAPVTLTVACSEIVGLFGLLGAGRTALLRKLFGLEPSAGGEVAVRGTPVQGGPASRIGQGMALVTEGRRDDGLCLSASIADNLLLASLRSFRRRGLLDGDAMRQAVRQVRAQVAVAPDAADHQQVSTLSGGNQQKVVLGKWLMTAPAVLLLDEPTRGIDIGARTDLYDRLRTLADGGASLLVASSDLDELLALCSRILVMRRGRINGEFDVAPEDASLPALREALLTAALPESVR